MARFIKDRSNASGKAPGSLIFIGRKKMEKPVIRLMDYDSKHLEEKELQNIEECRPCLQTDSVSWINIYGIHDLEMMQQISELFGYSPLFMEDLLNTDQMPKYEDGADYDAFILKMLHYDEQEDQIQAEQLTLVLGKNYVLTLQEQTGDVFNPVRERIRNNKGRVRLNDNDYLAYALLDTLVDHYIVLVETIGRKIEELETQIFRDPDAKVAQQIYHHKTELSFLRKNIRPVKEVMNHLLKSDNHLFQEKNLTFLNDLNDLVNQATEAIELYNGMVSDQLNIYNTQVSNRMNQVMKTLTIFASIFIPLTFIAGIYGMNFEHMPELGYKYSYLIFWVVILIIAISLLRYFRKKKWL